MKLRRSPRKPKQNPQYIIQNLNSSKGGTNARSQINALGMKRPLSPYEDGDPNAPSPKRARTTEMTQDELDLPILSLPEPASDQMDLDEDELAASEVINPTTTDKLTQNGVAGTAAPTNPTTTNEETQDEVDGTDAPMNLTTTDEATQDEVAGISAIAGPPRVPHEMLLHIINDFLAGNGNFNRKFLQDSPALGRAWYSLVMDKCIVDVFPNFVYPSRGSEAHRNGERITKVTVKNRPALLSVSCGIPMDLSYQFEALQSVVYQWRSKGFSFTEIEVDLSGLSDTLALKSLGRLRDIYSFMHRTNSPTPCPGLNITVDISTRKLLDLIAHAGHCGASHCHIQVHQSTWKRHVIEKAGKQAVVEWETTHRFGPDHFPSASHIHIKGDGLLNHPVFVSSLLKQDSVRALQITNISLGYSDWDFIFHAIHLPKLVHLKMEGSFNPPHLYEFFERHPDLRAISLGRWSTLSRNNGPLCYPRGLLMLSGPHPILGAMVGKNTRLRGLTRLLLMPYSGDTYWKPDSVKRLLELVSQSPTVKTLAIEIDQYSLAKFSGLLSAGLLSDMIKPDMIQVEKFIIVQKSPLVFEVSHTRAIRALLNYLPNDVFLTLAGSVLIEPEELRALRLELGNRLTFIDYAQWKTEWNVIDEVEEK